MLRFIFYTDKGTGETEFRGQTNKAENITDVNRVAKKVIGQAPSHIVKQAGVTSAHTEDEVVDFVDKDVFKGDSPFKTNFNP